MRRQHSIPPGAFVELCFRPPERSNSARVHASPLRSTGLASPVVVACTLIGLVAMVIEGPSPEPEAQIWVGRAVDCGAVDNVIPAPDGKTLASIDSHRQAKLWNVANGRTCSFQPEGFDRIRSLAFSPNSKTLAGGSLDSAIILWDMETLETRGMLRAHPSQVGALAYSPDGKMLASADGDGTLILWQTTTPYRSIHECRSSSGITSLVFSPDGATLATSHSNGEVRIRNVRSPHYSSVVAAHHSSYPRRIAFSPDGRILAISTLTTSQVLLWDLPSGRVRASFVGPAKGVPGLAYSPDGNVLVVTGSDGVMQLRDPMTGYEFASVQAHRARVCSVAFSPDGGSLASCGNDQCIRLWNVATLLSPGAGITLSSDARPPSGEREKKSASGPRN